ncbi:choice-of-anchor L domain-containing protein [Lacinutrix sp.]|uniref:choice-of-anchor L domain-containing protein n=1 Tax=Lacinutrix sp. TaxID=1937692 RepID=UPI0025C66F61|nr:choice-of-anchor L domain-containing protein [Lacinutrix sp.]
MKKITLLFILIAFNYSFSQMTINDAFTTQQLIEDQLIGNPNFPTSNFISSTGTDFGSVNGLAAFNSNGADIAFSQGIVLSTGNVLSIPGANITVISEGGNSWPGDTDLESATSVNNTNNASFIQFDFVAQVEAISLDFIMASEEYGTFECGFPDTFAFFLTDLTSGVTINIAVVPGTVTPISIFTVRGGGNNDCNPVNDSYFDRYNFDVSAATANPDYIIPEISPINFNGQTEVFTLMGNLVIGNNYRIKIVIADASDTAFDSALFIRKSSFGAVPLMEQEPSDIVIVDNDNDGSSVFNLRVNEPQMLGSVDTSIYSFGFDYYTTLADAEAETNAISNPEAYTNTADPETVYVNMRNTFTDMFITNSFKIATDPALLSVEDFILDQVKVYPNPVVDKLQISNQDGAITGVEIYNIRGQLVTSLTNDSTNTLEINFESYTKGVYLVRLISNQGSSYRRIIK